MPKCRYSRYRRRTRTAVHIVDDRVKVKRTFKDGAVLAVVSRVDPETRAELVRVLREGV